MTNHHKKSQADNGQSVKKPVPESSKPATVKDPVCGMTVHLNAGKPSHQWNGKEFHFCSEKCHEKFVADPYFYASGNNEKKKHVVTKDTTYTCPMHPQIIQDKPGSCPICGMALESMNGVSDEPNHELIDFTRRLWVSAAGSHTTHHSYDGTIDRLTGQELDRYRIIPVAGVCAGDTSHTLGGMAIFPARLGINQDLEPQHVDADYDRRWYRIHIQRHCHFLPRPVSSRLENGRGPYAGLL